MLRYYEKLAVEVAIPHDGHAAIVSVLKRLRRSVMALGIAGVVAASALAAGIATSGTADAGSSCTFERFNYTVASGTGDTIRMVYYECTMDGYSFSGYYVT